MKQHNKALLQILIIIFSFICPIFGQESDRVSKNSIYNGKSMNVYALHGDSIKENPVSLAKGWRFIPNHSMEYAKPNFNDSTFQLVNINFPLDSFPDHSEDKIVWLTKKIIIDSSFLDKILYLYVRLPGTTEIYIDGKLNFSFGKFEIPLSESDVFSGKTSYFLPLQFHRTGEHAIAIRYLLHRQSRIRNSLEFDFAKIGISSNQNAIADEYDHLRQIGNRRGFGAGAFFILGLVHFVFYYLFRSQKFNFRFSIAMLMFCVSLAMNTINEFYNSLNEYAITIFAGNLLYILGHLFLLSASYDYVGFPRKKLFWSFVILSLIGLIFEDLHILPSYFKLIIYLLLILNYVYIIVNASKDNHHANTLRTAFIYFSLTMSSIFIFLIVYFIFYKDIDSNVNESSLMTIFGIAFLVGPQLSISGCITFSLAKEFIKANLSLSQKIKEVEDLAKTNQEILANQNIELESKVNTRTTELRDSIEELKNTQKQLIQSEKMASLGELTAGIAHEIKNPLNFVNNFSDINVELISEMEEELSKKNIEGSLELVTQIKENFTKISSHGRRADSIVRSMLEHSRSSNGIKLQTDLNKLISEYVNLAYHGLRAKDKSFNSKIALKLDPTLSSIAIVSQDMGRVILNLTTNAFHAVNEKANKLKLMDSSDAYEPTLTVSTSQSDDTTTIIVTDNGSGMPQHIMDKIFQPFFTTKPTGQGTGLGLSLTYDIVQAHNGTIKVKSAEGEGSEFRIELPCE